MSAGGSDWAESVEARNMAGKNHLMLDMMHPVSQILTLAPSYICGRGRVKQNAKISAGDLLGRIIHIQSSSGILPLFSIMWQDAASTWF
jgi:hypothetical protein